MFIKVVSVLIRCTFSILNNYIITLTGESIHIHLKHDMPTSTTGMVRSTHATGCWVL